MTPDEPERLMEGILRAKAQEIRDYVQRKFDIYGYIGSTHADGCREDIALCEDAANALHAAEKRAEDAERERDEWKVIDARGELFTLKCLEDLRIVQSERDSARAALGKVVEDAALMAEARADSFIKTGEQIGWAERENWAVNMRDLAKAIRTALQASSG